jgi:hypothetical protein
LDGTRSFFTGAHARRQEQTFYLQQIVRSSAGGRQSTGKDETSKARVGRIVSPNFIEILMVWQWDKLANFLEVLVAFKNKNKMPGHQLIIIGWWKSGVESIGI